MHAFILGLWLVCGVARAEDVPAPLDGAGLLDAYDAIRADLVADEPAPAVDAARLLADHAPDATIREAALAVAAAADLPAMRLAFAELSRVLVLHFGDSPPDGVHAYHCPMVEHGYAYWLQEVAGLQNPYMGQAMPGCGEAVSLKAAVRAAAPEP